MLWQEPGIQALQVLNQDDKWIDAPPIPGTLVMKYVPWIKFRSVREADTW